MKLDDPSLDQIDPDARETELIEALRDQVAFMRAEVPFWKNRLAALDADEDWLGSWDDLARLPILTKAELRATRPGDLLPQVHRSAIHIGRWTSGTTGRPTASFWSETDWTALVVSTARMLTRQAPMQSPVVFSGYSHAHLTGPLYHAALNRLGALVFDRSHHPEDVFSTPDHLDQFDFDTLVLPERSKPGKGVGLMDLLDADPGLLADRGLRWWIGSSKTFAAESITAVQRCGVESISNLYGSSEFGVFAISCPEQPGDYHIAQGHVLVEVVDTSGVHVASGRTGRVVVTHLRGADEDGRACTRRGTQLLRLATGDGATFVGEPCQCGLRAARLRAIHRLGAER